MMLAEGIDVPSHAGLARMLAVTYEHITGEAPPEPFGVIDEAIRLLVR
jgi:hypothetical protein